MKYYGSTPSKPGFIASKAIVLPLDDLPMTFKLKSI